MCTVTAWPKEGGYRVLFNRDEQRSRAAGEPPAVRESGGMRLVSPLDPEGGGAWIGCNAAGITAGLLNYYHAGNIPADDATAYRSRGLLVLELLAAPRLEEAAAVPDRGVLARYRPFELFAIAPPFRGCHWRWDGKSLVRADLDPGRPWWASSSSFRPREVLTARRRAFERLLAAGPTAADAFGYHVASGQSPDAATTLMLRDDARTVSLTEIQVDARRVEIATWPVDASGRPASRPHRAALDRAAP